jgi:predicted metal-dependent hydrolase
MDTTQAQYDPRYLAGVVLFNRGDFFEAHEVWESIWMEAGPDKKFYQGLIQAAVALCHFCNGNGRGAVKLFKSSRDYMSRYDRRPFGSRWNAVSPTCWQCPIPRAPCRSMRS